jgi:hypothetical protein
MWRRTLIFFPLPKICRKSLMTALRSGKASNLHGTKATHMAGGVGVAVVADGVEFAGENGGTVSIAAVAVVGHIGSG